MVIRCGAGVLAVVHGTNGLFMLVDPSGWWGRVPGVTETGPFNPHFVADVGLAFLASAIGLAIFAAAREARWAGVAAASFPALHAGLHVAEMADGGSAHAGLDAAAIVVPAIVGLLICIPWKGARHA